MNLQELEKLLQQYIEQTKTILEKYALYITSMFLVERNFSRYYIEYGSFNEMLIKTFQHLISSEEVDSILEISIRYYKDIVNYYNKLNNDVLRKTLINYVSGIELSYEKEFMKIALSKLSQFDRTSLLLVQHVLGKLQFVINNNIWISMHSTDIPPLILYLGIVELEKLRKILDLQIQGPYELEYLICDKLMKTGILFIHMIRSQLSIDYSYYIPRIFVKPDFLNSLM